MVKMLSITMFLRENVPPFLDFFFFVKIMLARRYFAQKIPLERLLKIS